MKRHVHVGQFCWSAVVLACGFGLCCAVAMVPGPIIIGVTPHWFDFACIAAAGLLAWLVGGIGITLSVKG